jgi:hypothetical protein
MPFYSNQAQSIIPIGFLLLLSPFIFGQKETSEDDTSENRGPLVWSFDQRSETVSKSLKSFRVAAIFLR